MCISQCHTLFAALAVAASCFCFFLIYCSMCLFVQWQIFVCAMGNLHEADLGIKAYAVEVFISLEAVGYVFCIGAYSG